MFQKIKLLVCFILWGGLVQAELKIGYVDSNEIMSSFEEVRQVQVDLEKEQRRLEKEMNDLMGRLDSLNQDYDRQRLLMSESRRQEKEIELKKIQESIQKFQLDKNENKNPRVLSYAKLFLKIPQWTH